MYKCFSAIAFIGLTYVLTGCGANNKQQSTANQSVMESSVAESEPLANRYAQVYGDSIGAVASVNPLATEAGINALRAGGNAIDAALAAAFSLGVVDSHNSGIGGGCFILVRLANGEILAIDGREMAPAAAHRDMYIVDGQPQKEWSKTGALASGVPGSVAALHQLQSMAGKLTFADVILPAAALAEKGFVVDNTLAARIAAKQSDLRRFPATAKIFLDRNGEPWRAGDRLVQADLAKSYRSLAKSGPDWFYRGGFAEATAKWMASNGGMIVEADFAQYKTAYRTPIKSQFKGFSVVGFPPPSSGGIHVAQILSMLEGIDLADLSEAERLHAIAEVMRRAFADRARWLGDPDFVDVPSSGLLDKDYLVQRMADFSFAKASDSISYGVPFQSQKEAERLFNKHTTHISTADKYGNWVAITTTLNTSFGSKVVVPGTGVLLNNQMDDFSIQPGVANAFGLIGAEANSIAPGKRPLSSMSPTLVLHNGKPLVALGAAGGPTIISQVAQTLIYRLALDYSIEQAVANPRIHHQWRPNMLFVEPVVDKTVTDILQSKGHSLKSMGSFGGTQAIEIRNGALSPVTEPRLIKRNSGQ